MLAGRQTEEFDRGFLAGIAAGGPGEALELLQRAASAEARERVAWRSELRWRQIATWWAVYSAVLSLYCFWRVVMWGLETIGWIR